MNQHTPTAPQPPPRAGRRVDGHGAVDSPADATITQTWPPRLSNAL